MERSAYARIRLWSGIVSIGLHLTLAWAAYATHALWGPLFREIPTVASTLFLAVAFTGAGFGLDVLTGHAVETGMGRSRQAFRSWCADWIRGAARFILALWAGLSFFALTASWSVAAHAGAVTGLAVGLGFLAKGWHRWIPSAWFAAPSTALEAHEAAVRAEMEPWGFPDFQIRWITDPDTHTVNGWLQGGRSPVLWLSTNVARHLTPRQTALMAAREWGLVRSGSARAATVIAVLWLLAGGLGIPLLPAGEPLERAAGAAAWMTSWCFLALWIWPHLNRRWSAAADRLLLQWASAPEVRSLLERLQVLNGTDTTLPATTTAIFHPLPPLEERIGRLETTPS